MSWTTLLKITTEPSNIPIPMKRLASSCAMACAVSLAAHAATITVNTTNNISPGVGETNLVQAINLLQNGDTIGFNIPGAGPHYLLTPPCGGYPKITNNNVTINGYTQPGAVANTNTILGSNTAKIKIVLDSRNGQFTDGTYQAANGNSGFNGEGVMLCIFNATNVHLQGLCLLGMKANLDTTNCAGAQFDETCAIGVERDYSGGAAGLGNGMWISGCWIGVDVDGTTVSACDNGPRAERHRDDTIGNAARLPANNAIIGVRTGSLNPRAEFNVIVGHTEDVLLEGQGHRVSGNFLGVLPDGMHDYIVPFAELGVFQESHIEIG